MEQMDDYGRIYSLLSIFRIFSTTEEYRILSGSVQNRQSLNNESGPMQLALKYIMQNFQKPILIKDLLEITGMSNTSFYAKFKRTYRMSFKEYLLNTRVGYACKLLTEGSYSISEVAYKSGFENLSNFNRHFKKIRGVTPTGFQKKAGAAGKGKLASIQIG
jgi:AraC-like DNA-binding protein